MGIQSWLFQVLAHHFNHHTTPPWFIYDFCSLSPPPLPTLCSQPISCWMSLAMSVSQTWVLPVISPRRNLMPACEYPERSLLLQQPMVPIFTNPSRPISAPLCRAVELDGYREILPSAVFSCDVGCWRFTFRVSRLMQMFVSIDGWEWDCFKAYLCVSSEWVEAQNMSRLNYFHKISVYRCMCWMLHTEALWKCNIPVPKY